MRRTRIIFRDYKIRPRGSPEVPYDPMIIVQMYRLYTQRIKNPKNDRKAKIYIFLIKTAMEVLPPKQRKMFYSVWVRSHGRLSKGIMEYSRKTNQNHYTAYNNYYKAINSLKKHLKKKGYWDYLLEYLHKPMEEEEDEIF